MIPTDSSAVKRLCPRGSKDHATRSSFSHELNPDQAERVFPDGTIRQFVRRFSFLSDPKLFEFVRWGHRISRSGIYLKERLERFLWIH